ncbi:gfo/Idh/MocA family oxidoreductase [candidate division KSB1 bacterium]|nr:Gfo/Idh/MocA family oxidoreductase [candidate division KSB1 bacterium]RQW06092.1 MAG: gfo/Idh/MocA family oxidoreductase [candidate division KSB1 bacterium]
MAQEEKNLTRREFVKRTSQTTATIAAASAITGPFFPGKVLGANDQVTIAHIGIRGQGGSHIDGFGKIPGVKIKTICDVDENLFPARLKAIQERFGYTPNTEWNMQEVFSDKDIDAVTFATPNHWHALGTIWACQAKKHVYVEKPSCWSIWEGRQMVYAARANNVLVQVGFQNRSRKNTMAAIKFLNEGGIGKVYMGRGLCYKPRWDIGRYPDGPMQPGEEFYLRTNKDGKMPTYTQEYCDKVHYDMWIGPARYRPFNRNRFHYNWHWDFEYGNGDTGNQGPHQFDVGRWGLNKEEYPVKIRSMGGYYIFDSQQNTPNTQTTIFEYADGTIFEFGTRGLFTPADGKISIGNIFYGSDGWLEIDAGGNWKTYFGYRGEPGPNSDNIEEEESDALVTVGTGTGGHYGNFIAAVRSGKQEDLNCDIEVGHRSSVLPHLGNISYMLGREVIFDGKKEKFVDDPDADKLLRRETYREPYVVSDMS